MGRAKKFQFAKKILFSPLIYYLDPECGIDILKAGDSSPVKRLKKRLKRRHSDNIKENLSLKESD